MKKLFAFLLTAGISHQLHAQKILKGDLSFLKGIKEINFSFNYDNMMVGEEGEEANYVKRKKAEKGDEWEKNWIGDR